MINIVMQKHPLKACVALRFMYVPSFVKNYYLPLFDVPAAALFLAGSISSFFYCAAFCYVGSTIDTLADAAVGKASGDGGAIKVRRTLFCLDDAEKLAHSNFEAWIVNRLRCPYILGVAHCYK